MVVEEHPLMAKAVGQMLVRLGYGAVLTAGVYEALGRLVEERFDAVLSDVRMQGMNGLELLQEIHVRHPHLPVILMSVFANEPMREAALDWGAAALLCKPFGLEELETALKSACGEASLVAGAHAGGPAREILA